MFLSEIYLMQGRPQDALPEIERVGCPGMRMFLYAIAYHPLGRKMESDAALRELKYQAIDSYLIAEIYAFPDRAYATHSDGLIHTKVDPLLKSLHKDPRSCAEMEHV
jgi:hypothetical protein